MAIDGIKTPPKRYVTEPKASVSEKESKPKKQCRSQIEHMLEVARARAHIEQKPLTTKYTTINVY